MWKYEIFFKGEQYAGRDQIGLYSIKHVNLGKTKHI